MKAFALFGLAAAMLLGVGTSVADEPKMATPQKEHAWLKQLEGEWATDCEAVMGPGQAPMLCKGTQTTRTLGGFWVVSEMKGDMGGVPVVGHMTIGYDPTKKKYIGTWVCSVDPNLWTYEGTLAGNVLTLNTEGPNPMTGKTAKMRDVIEIKDKDTMTMKSEMVGDDGKWTKIMTMTGKRTK